MNERASAGCLLVACVLGWGAVFPSRASAEPIRSTDRVVLEISACERAAADEVRRIVGVEIGDLLVAVGETAPAAANRLQIRCIGNMGSIEATGATGIRSVDRTLRLDDFPGDAAPRALALAGIETLAALSPAVRERVSARRNPELAGKPAPLPTTEPRSSAPPQSGEPRSFGVGIAGLLRTFSVAHGASAWGGRIDAEQEVGRYWQLALGLDLAGSRATTTNLGRVRALLYSGCAFWGLRSHGKHLGGSLNLGVRMGGVHLSGDANGRADVAARGVSHVWGGPVAAATSFVAVGPVGAQIAAEIGRSLSTSEGLADDASVMTVGGYWFALSIGVLFRYP
jgi:hypothetical protein